MLGEIAEGEGLFSVGQEILEGERSDGKKEKGKKEKRANR